MRLPTLLLLLICCPPITAAPTTPAPSHTYDIVVYGGTSGGIAAAVAARRHGKSVVLIAPDRRIGGLTTNGLGLTDIGNKHVVGGIALEFYQAIHQYYQSPDAWRQQRADDYNYTGQGVKQSDGRAMWTFEPSAALAVYEQWLARDGVPVLRDERLVRPDGVEKSGGRIRSIRLESGAVVSGRAFIDATYEGDLLAAAGVTYIVGREANATYDETLNGVQTSHAVKHQLLPDVSAYVKPGDPASGLLPGVDPTGPGDEGARDHRVQAYCYRMCLTNHPDNRVPVAKPAGFEPATYELLLRNFEAGLAKAPLTLSPMPNHKTDSNNNTGVSTDFIGHSYDYPEASYDRRDEIRREHLAYQQGLMWVLANDPRVPDKVRSQMSQWGVCRDEFTDTEGWPPELYVREARRMVGATVMTQHHCQGREVARDSVGMAAYTMDSHNVQRYADANGHARNEGDVQVGGFPPYPISYRALVPKQQECTNLWAPFCLSASHIAFGSIRMEPVFMVLSQSSVAAASIAIDRDVDALAVPYAELEQVLLDEQQVLTR
ncbi:putative FAD-binding dehydrogenase [Posidoniimonas polymericola]|uniref:Putative FAD-binding dehydrogenase n=1 Tax=Posidoniimonas polymericola TaxID=2528002 RepID=A0A5C5YTW6_9BACT|nr:FAD-dependent oxidoreductase [Posidoniimonas polymericola]TWT78123.1 putative FAD-binding dehydrogenase [Posidoniimonas polymericola]